MKAFNKALLEKWLWRSGGGTSFVEWGKYGITEGGWTTRDITLPFRCGLRRSILKILGKYLFNAGDVRRVNFGCHNWYGDILLKDDF